MKTKIEIKSILGEVLFTYEAENATIKDAVENAVLQKFNLIDADLRGADLRGAGLRGAYLFDAYLIDADLRGADLRGAGLRGAELRGANLRGAELRGANLRGANLIDADLIDADLIDADLRGANLRGAELRGAELRGANLRGANLRGANLRGAKNTENAYMPLFCKWSYSILGDKIQIGCETRTIEEWDEFFASTEELLTKRGTEEFKQIEAIYLACKAYLTHLKL